jgi:hypothetical protein
MNVHNGKTLPFCGVQNDPPDSSDPAFFARIMPFLVF